MTDARLPPFPDELLELGRRYEVIAFLRRLQLPYWIASRHFRRWAAVVGADVTELDELALGRIIRPKV